MDDDVGVGVGPAERARHASGGGPTPGHRRRMSAARKRDAVLRLLRGEDLELVSRELGVTAAELSGWREQFLAAGEASLRSRPADARDAEIGRLKEKVGDLTMTTELLEAKIGRLETARPLARRRSRPTPRDGSGGDPGGDEPPGLALHG
jgi:transposase-like protein